MLIGFLLYESGAAPHPWLIVVILLLLYLIEQAHWSLETGCWPSTVYVWRTAPWRTPCTSYSRPRTWSNSASRRMRTTLVHLLSQKPNIPYPSFPAQHDFQSCIFFKSSAECHESDIRIKGVLSFMVTILVHWRIPLCMFMISCKEVAQQLF